MQLKNVNSLTKNNQLRKDWMRTHSVLHSDILVVRVTMSKNDQQYHILA